MTRTPSAHPARPARGECQVSQQARRQDSGRQRLATGCGASVSRTQRSSLTGRGAVLLMAAASSAGLLAGSWLGWTALAGVAFILGSAAAARYTKPAALPTVVVTGPLLFFCALVAVKVLTAKGNALLWVAWGSMLTLADVAPWLFLGVVLSLVIALYRGLPRHIRRSRDQRPPARRQQAPHSDTGRSVPGRPETGRPGPGSPEAGHPGPGSPGSPQPEIPRPHPQPMPGSGKAMHDGGREHR